MKSLKLSKTKNHGVKNHTKHFPLIGLAAALAASVVLPTKAVDLLERYPAKLTGSLVQPDQALPWQFTQSDIFRVSSFRLEVAGQLKVETGPAELGIGHCADGAVLAILLPSEGGTLTRGGSGSGERIAHIWLRFHPGVINRLFPPDTVSAASSTSGITQMRTIAGAKFRASYHAGMKAMIPEQKDMTVDVDTKGGPRRFFVVDTKAGKAEYVAAFEKQPVRLAALNATASSRPKIIHARPDDGATDVDPGLTEVTVTFDQDMDEGFSWTGGGPEYPSSPQGSKAQWRGKRTCVLPVALESGHHYRVGINSPSYRNFRSTAGEAVVPSSISFTTK
jgi:hypothetical protein